MVIILQSLNSSPGNESNLQARLLTVTSPSSTSAFPCTLLMMNTSSPSDVQHDWWRHESRLKLNWSEDRPLHLTDPGIAAGLSISSLTGLTRRLTRRLTSLRCRFLRVSLPAPCVCWGRRRVRDAIIWCLKIQLNWKSRFFFQSTTSKYLQNLV